MSHGSVVYYQQNRERLNIDLAGCFDDYSAQKVIDLLRRISKNTSVVFVRTDRIEDIRPSSLASFHEGLSFLNDLCCRLVFVGKEANRLAPEQVGCL